MQDIVVGGLLCGALALGLWTLASWSTEAWLRILVEAGAFFLLAPPVLLFVGAGFDRSGTAWSAPLPSPTPQLSRLGRPLFLILEAPNQGAVAVRIALDISLAAAGFVLAYAALTATREAIISGKLAMLVLIAPLLSAGLLYHAANLAFFPMRIWLFEEGIVRVSGSEGDLNQSTLDGINPLVPLAAFFLVYSGPVLMMDVFARQPLRWRHRVAFGAGLAGLIAATAVTFLSGDLVYTLPTEYARSTYHSWHTSFVQVAAARYVHEMLADDWWSYSGITLFWMLCGGYAGTRLRPRLRVPR